MPDFSRCLRQLYYVQNSCSGSVVGEGMTVSWVLRVGKELVVGKCQVRRKERARQGLNTDFDTFVDRFPAIVHRRIHCPQAGFHLLDVLPSCFSTASARNWSRKEAKYLSGWRTPLQEDKEQNSISIPDIIANILPAGSVTLP